jgi:hypothetical protein
VTQALLPTPLTPAGLACLAVLVVVLFGREFRALRPDGAPQRRLRLWTWAAVLPAIGLLVVVVERVLVLS